MELVEALVDVVLVDVLKDVVAHDEVEALVVERQLRQLPLPQFRLRDPCARELDRRLGDVRPSRLGKDPAVERPAEEAAGAAACIEETLAGSRHPVAEQRRRQLAHPHVPPVLLLGLEDPLVVVGGNARSKGRSGRGGHALHGRRTRHADP